MVVLRHLASGCFVGPTGALVVTVEEAVTFPSREVAEVLLVRHCCEPPAFSVVERAAAEALPATVAA